MRGKITLSELKDFDKKIKSFPAGKEGQKRGIEFAKKMEKRKKE